MTRRPPAPSLDDLVRQLEAERLAPVPGPSRAVAVDLADVAVLLRLVTRRRLPPGAALAYDRLAQLVRSRP